MFYKELLVRDILWTGLPLLVYQVPVTTASPRDRVPPWPRLTVTTPSPRDRVPP